MCPDSEATVSMVVKIHFLVGPISDILLLCLPPQTSFLFVLLSFPKTELVTKVVKTFRPFFFSLLQILFLDQLRFMSHMKIRVKQASIVKPAEETPIHSLWLSNLDLIQVRFHMGILYFYNPCSSSSLPNTPSLIDALRKVLVLFYPAAGRLQKGKDFLPNPDYTSLIIFLYFFSALYVVDKNERLEVLCNGEGVLLVEAETDSTIQDVGLLTQALDLSELVPTLAYSGDISSLPLLLFQVSFSTSVSFKTALFCTWTQ